jgi:integrase/recombinase XerD
MRNVGRECGECHRVSLTFADNKNTVGSHRFYNDAAIRRKREPGDALIGRTNGNTDRSGIGLDGLKTIAGRAKLDKGNFWLHKFRATFATWSLWAGVDLRTVQQWLGHSDMESTMRYLKPSRSQQVRDKINEIFA